MTATDRPQYLYLIRWGSYVKVGCSVDPMDRLIRVTERGARPPHQRGLPELIAAVPGGLGAEAWLHAALAGEHATGEWFHLRGPVADLVDYATRATDVPTRARKPSGPRHAHDSELRTMVTGRGAQRPDHQLRHAAVPAAGGITRALCGTRVALQLGPWDPHPPNRDARSVCVTCRRGAAQPA